MSPSVGVVVFPGSNCDHDTVHVLRNVCGAGVREVWHKEGSLDGLEAVVLPGGFSYGDYLRSGAIARFSPVMGAVVEFAGTGRPVLGICNGFQILQEVGLLPGAMLRNRSVKFLSQDVWVRVESDATAATRGLRPGSVLRMPIAHGEGNFHAEPELLDELEQKDRVVFRYVSPPGEPGASANPNGSARAVAGVCNAERNVVGLMPHPERAAEPALGCSDGRALFDALLGALAAA